MVEKQGYLIINVKKAILTHDTELMGKMDPYTVLKIGRLEQKTTVKAKAGKTPEWNEVLEFPANAGDLVLIQVWDKEELIADDFVGDAKFVLDPTKYQVKQTSWFPIYFGEKRNEKGGEILLEIEYVLKAKDPRDYERELQEKEKEIAQLLGHKGDLHEVLKKSTEEKDFLSTALETHKSEFTKLKTDNAGLQAEVQTLKERIIVLEKELQEKNGKASTLLVSNEDLRARDEREENLKSEIESLKKQLESLKKSENEHSLICEEKMSQVEKERQEAEKSINDLTQKYDDCNKSCALLKEQLLKAQEDKTECEKKIKGKDTEIQNLQSHLAKAQKDINQLIDDLTKKVKAEKSSNNSLTFILVAIIVILIGLLLRNGGAFDEYNH